MPPNPATLMFAATPPVSSRRAFESSRPLRLPVTRRLLRCLIFLVPGILLVASAGCAVRYSDSRNGAEHLWGFGNLRLSCVTNSSLATVVAGCRVPGICIEIGRENFGLSLGWLERQRLQVVNTQATREVMIPGATPRFLSHAESDGIWALGHLKMRTVPAPEHRYAIVTGRALAGIGGDAGPGERGFGAGLNHGQRTEVIDENVRVDLDMRASRWPGFDYFSAEVSAATPMDLKTNKHNQTP